MLWVFIFSVWPHDLDKKPTSADIIANTLMDINPSPTIAESLLVTILHSKPVICLTYSLVPSLDIPSQSYQQAVMTLGKQQVVLGPVTK